MQQKRKLLTINDLVPIDVSGRNSEMRKFRSDILQHLSSGILRKILIFGWIPLVLVHSPVWGQKSIQILMTKKGAFNLAYTSDSFRPFFKDPYETLVVVLNDGRCLLFSDQDENTVIVFENRVNNLLKELGYRMEDVVIVVHNHLKPQWFSIQDKKFCCRLVRLGFRGKFLVYFPLRNETIEYMYKKEN